MHELLADLPRLHALGPADDQRVGDAPQVGELLVEPVRRVRRIGPADRIMREGRVLAHHVHQLRGFRHRHRAPEGRREHIGGAGLRPLGGTAIVGKQQHQRVVGDPQLLQPLHQPPDIGVHIRQHGGIDLHVARIERLLLGAQAVPGLRARRQRRQRHVSRHDPQRLLLLQPGGADRIPALVIMAPEPVPLAPSHLQGRMHARKGHLQEKGSLGLKRLLCADIGAGPVGQVVHHIIVVGPWGLHRRHPVEQLAGREKVRRMALEPVGAFEPAVGRPVVIGAVGAGRMAAVHMPFADQHRVPAGIAQYLGDGRRFVRQVAPIAGIARVHVGQPAHPRRMVVEPGQEGRACRAAHGGGAEVRIAKPARRQRIDVGRRDFRTVAAEIGEAHIIQDDRHHIRRARLPILLGHVDRAAVGKAFADLGRPVRHGLGRDELARALFHLARTHGGGPGNPGANRPADQHGSAIQPLLSLGPVTHARVSSQGRQSVADSSGRMSAAQSGVRAAKADLSAARHFAW